MKAMNKNLDLTKILQGCPKGTKFYHSVYGEVCLTLISENGLYPIILSVCQDGSMISVTEDGRLYECFNGDCVLFPSKEQRDWSKFERFWDTPKVEKFDVNTLQPFDKVLARDYPKEYWRVDIFSFMIDEIACCTTAWRCCIPYNDETKHLLGTTDDCPEYYKWWEGQSTIYETDFQINGIPNGVGVAEVLATPAVGHRHNSAVCVYALEL